MNLVQAKTDAINGVAWALGVVVTGSPVVTDPADPNSSAPAANRILVANWAEMGTLYRGAINPARLMFLIKGGTSLAYQPWFYDNTITKWVKFGAGNFSNADVAGAAIPCVFVPGMQVYVQITTVTGAVTEFRYTFN